MGKTGLEGIFPLKIEGEGGREEGKRGGREGERKRGRKEGERGVREERKGKGRKKKKLGWKEKKNEALNEGGGQKENLRFSFYLDSRSS